MPGRQTIPDEIRLASGRQLWRLNQLGVLSLDGEPHVTSARARDALAAELAAYGLRAFPQAGEEWPERRGDDGGTPPEDAPSEGTVVPRPVPAGEET
jgi:hypothetical protein